MNQYNSNPFSGIISPSLLKFEIPRFPGEPYEIRFGVASYGRYHERPGCGSPRDVLATSWGSLRRGCGGTHKEKWGAFSQRLHQVAGKKWDHNYPWYVAITSLCMGMCLFGYFFQINFKFLNVSQIFGLKLSLKVPPTQSVQVQNHHFLRIPNSFPRENIWTKSVQVLGCDDYDKVVLFLGHDDVGWRRRLKGKDPIGDTPIFHWTMTMEGYGYTESFWLYTP